MKVYRKIRVSNRIICVVYLGPGVVQTGKRPNGKHRRGFFETGLFMAKVILLLGTVLWAASPSFVKAAASGQGRLAGRSPKQVVAQLPSWLAALRGKNQKKATAARAMLSKLGKETVPVLRAALKQERNIAAAEALAACLTALGEKFSDPRAVTPEIGREIQRRCRPLATAADLEQADAALGNLLRFGGVPAPWLFTVFRNPRANKTLRLRTARALAAMGYEKTAPLLVAALADEETADEVRDEILGLGPAAAACLRRRGLTARDPGVRKRSAMLLGWFGAALNVKETKGLAADLLAVTHDHKSAVRREAAIALANLRDETIFPALLRDVRQVHTSEPFLIQALGTALASSAGTSGGRELLSLLAARRAVTREIGAVAVGLWAADGRNRVGGNIGAEAALLLKTLVRDASSNVQQRAAEALGVLAERKVHNATASVANLRRALARGRAAVRLAAALALGEAAAKGATLGEATRRLCLRTTKLPRLALAAGVCRVALMTVTEQASVAGGTSTAEIPEYRKKMIAERKQKYKEEQEKKKAPLVTTFAGQQGFRYRGRGRICCVCPRLRGKTSSKSEKSGPSDTSPTTSVAGMKQDSEQHRAPMSSEKKSGGSAEKAPPPKAVPDMPRDKEVPGLPGTRRYRLGTGFNPYAPESGRIYTTYLRILDE